MYRAHRQLSWILIGICALCAGLASAAQAPGAEAPGPGKPSWWQSGAHWRMDEPLLRAWWVWHDKDMLADREKSKAFVFTKTVDLPTAPRTARLRVSAQGGYTLSINGRAVGADDNVVTLDDYNVTPFLVKGRNTLVIHAKSNLWFAGLFVCGSVETADGRKIEILSDRTWTVAPEEGGPARPAGQVVRGLNGGFWNNVGRLLVLPAAAYRLNTTVETPGIDWAKPWGGAPMTVLALHPRGRQRDTVELAQRTGWDVRATFTDGNLPRRGETAPFFPITKGLRPEDIQAAVAAALRQPADVIIFGGLYLGGGTPNLAARASDIFYATVADRLKDIVANGGGLVYIEGSLPPRMTPAGKDAKGRDKFDLDRSFEKELTAHRLAATPPFLASGVPYSRLPGLHPNARREVRDLEQVATLFTCGKGRVVRLSRCTFGGYGLFANVPADRNDLHYQYYLSFAARLMLWAADKEPAVQFKDFPRELAATDGKLAVTLQNVPAGCTAALAVRSPDKLALSPAHPLATQGQERGDWVTRAVFKATCLAPAGANVRVAFALPALPAGTYFVDVTLSAGGRKLNWASAGLTVDSPQRLARLTVSKPYIVVADGGSDTIGVTAVLTEPAAAGTALRFSLLDNYDRVLARKTVPLAAGAKSGSVSFPVRSFATCLGRIRAELAVGDRVLDVVAASFTTIRRDWDRFTFFAWTGGPVGHEGNVYLRALAELGLDASQYHGIDLDWLEAADRVALPAYPFPHMAGNVTDTEKMIAEYAARSKKILDSQLRFDPIGFTKGDEFHYGGGDESPARVVDYRRWLKARYGDIAKLNGVWGSQYRSFDEIYPVTGKSLPSLKAEKGAYVPRGEFLAQANATRNYSRIVDQWLNNYKVYADLARVSLKTIKGLYPQARLGMDCPMWPHAYSGHDWYTFMQEFDFFAPYGRGGEIIPLKQARSYKRAGQFIGLEYGGYLYMAFNRKEELTDTEWQRWRIWSGLLQGFSSVWWYQLSPPGNECNLGPGFEPYPTLRTAADEIARVRKGYYTLLNPLRRDYGPVALHDSVVSRITDSFLPADFSAGSYGHNMDTHLAMHILENMCGYQYTFVSDAQIAQGGLDHYRVLVMPVSVAIGCEQARALRTFVERGGTLIADVRPGIFDGSGKWDESQTVPALFGLAYKKTLGRTQVKGVLTGRLLGRDVRITPEEAFPVDPAVELKGAHALCQVGGHPVVTVNQVGKGRAICLNIPFTYYRGTTMPDSLYAYWGDPDHNRLMVQIVGAVLRGLGTERLPRVDTTPADGSGRVRPAPFGLDASFFADGTAQYIGLCKRREADDEPVRRVTVHGRQAGHVYDMIDGGYFGETAAWPVDLRSADVRLFSILPYRVRALKARAAVADGAITGTVTVDTGGAKPVRHVIHLDVTRPDGKSVKYMARNLQTADGRATFSIPLALNEMPGTYTLAFTDVATQTKTVLRVNLK